MSSSSSKNNNNNFIAYIAGGSIVACFGFSLLVTFVGFVLRQILRRRQMLKNGVSTTADITGKDSFVQFRRNGPNKTVYIVTIEWTATDASQRMQRLRRAKYQVPYEKWVDYVDRVRHETLRYNPNDIYDFDLEPNLEWFDMPVYNLVRAVAFSITLPIAGMFLFYLAGMFPLIAGTLGSLVFGTLVCLVAFWRKPNADKHVEVLSSSETA